LTAGSDINSGKIVAFEAETTTTGDYSHKKKAYDKGVAVLNQKQLKDPNMLYNNLYKREIRVRNPSNRNI
jgi:hypothetical protein